MGILDLVKKKKVAKKVGTIADIATRGAVDKYYIEFKGLEGTPTYELKESISIGSKVGDIILPESGLAPRHCTITVNQGVITLMDHGTQEGTVVGKKEIPPGRMIILQESDVLKLGDVEARILKEEVPIEEEEIDETPIQAQTLSKEALDQTITQPLKTPDFSPPPAEPAAPPATPPADVGEHTQGGFEINTQFLTGPQSTVSEEDRTQDIDDNLLAQLAQASENSSSHDENNEEQDKKKKETKYVKIKKKKLSMGLGKTVEATSSLFRLFAILNEVLICASLYIVAIGNESLMSILNELPKDLFSIVAPLYNETLGPVLAEVLKDYPVVTEMFKDLGGTFGSSTQMVWQFLILFFGLRLFSVLIFGVTIGQKMIGLSSYGNILLKRVQGFFRELMGIFTLPFLLFDLPSLFSKRTVKEILTFSSVQTNSLAKSFILTPLSFLFLAALFLVTPIFQGAQLRLGIPVISAKIKNEQALMSGTRGHYFNLVFDSSDYKLESLYEIKMLNGTNSVESSLDIYREDTLLFNFSQYKKFNLQDLIKTVFSLNPLAREQFAELAKFAYAPSTGPMQAKKINPKLFAQQLQALIQTSFALELNTLQEHVTQYGPLIKGFVDFRDEVGHLVGGHFEQVEIKTVGETLVAVFEMNMIGKSKIYRFFPLLPRPGIVYQVSSPISIKSAKELSDLLAKIRFVAPEGFSESTSQIAMHEIDLLNGEFEGDALQSEQSSLFKRLFDSYMQIISEKKSGDALNLKLQRIIKVIDHHFMKDERSARHWTSTYQELINLQKAYKDKDQRYFKRMEKKLKTE